MTSGRLRVGQAVTDTDTAGSLREAPASRRHRGRRRGYAWRQSWLWRRGYDLPQGGRRPGAHRTSDLRGRGLYHQHGGEQHAPGGRSKERPDHGSGTGIGLPRDDRTARTPGRRLPSQVRDPRSGDPEGRHQEVPEGSPPGEGRRDAARRRGVRFRGACGGGSQRAMSRRAQRGPFYSLFAKAPAAEIWRAARSAPSVDPSTYTGAATAPPTSPESAPARLPATAALLPQEKPIKPATRIPTSEPSKETSRPTTPPMPPQIIPTLTAPPRSSLSSMPAF